MANKLPSFTVASGAISARKVSMGEAGAGLFAALDTAAEAVTVPPSRMADSKHGPSLDSPMGRVCIHLHELARGVNSGEGLTRQSQGGYYTCTRVFDELCEGMREPDADAAQVYATMRARSGLGARGARGSLKSATLPVW